MKLAAMKVGRWDFVERQEGWTSIDDLCKHNAPLGLVPFDQWNLGCIIKHDRVDILEYHRRKWTVDEGFIRLVALHGAMKTLRTFLNPSLYPTMTQVMVQMVNEHPNVDIIKFLQGSGIQLPLMYPRDEHGWRVLSDFNLIKMPLLIGPRMKLTAHATPAEFIAACEDADHIFASCDWFNRDAEFITALLLKTSPDVPLIECPTVPSVWELLFKYKPETIAPHRNKLRAWVIAGVQSTYCHLPILPLLFDASDIYYFENVNFWAHPGVARFLYNLHPATALDVIRRSKKNNPNVNASYPADRGKALQYKRDRRFLASLV